ARGGTGGQGGPLLGGERAGRLGVEHGAGERPAHVDPEPIAHAGTIRHLLPARAVAWTFLRRCAIRERRPRSAPVPEEPAMSTPLVAYAADARVGVITLNRPDKLNAISPELKRALVERF